jgi:hypothetical protein
MTRIKTRTRTLANGAPGRSLYLLYDPKSRKHHGAESFVEYEGLLAMLYDRDIRSMEVQAERFTVPGPEGDFECIPDVRLIRADGVIEFREFKQDIEALAPEERARLQRIQAHLQGLGYSYTVEDARSWRQGHRLANIKLLYRYAALEPDTALLSWLRKRLRARPGTYDIWTFRTQAGDDRLPDLYRLLWDQSIGVDIDSAPLGDESLLWRVEA